MIQIQEIVVMTSSKFMTLVYMVESATETSKLQLAVRRKCDMQVREQI